MFEGDSNDEVCRIVERIEQLGSSALGFAFLDPQGIELKFSTVARLSENRRVDLLINFPLGMNIKRQLTYRLEAEDDQFDEYFGTPEWREIALVEKKSVGQIGSQLLDLYKRQLSRLGYGFIGDDRSVKNRGVSLYQLVFASKDARGEDFWRKVVRFEPTGQRKLFG